MQNFFAIFFPRCKFYNVIQQTKIDKVFKRFFTKIIRAFSYNSNALQVKDIFLNKTQSYMIK